MYPEYLSQPKAQPKKKAPVVAALTGAQQASAEIEVLPVQGNVYMLAGAGSNITVQTGLMGVLVVDTGSARCQVSSALMNKVIRASNVRSEATANAPT